MKNNKLTMMTRLLRWGRLSVSLLFLMVMASAITLAQNRVSGTVSDDDGNALPGVTVFLQGTNTGVITDDNGAYTLEADPGGTLIFSMIAFETQSVTIGADGTMNVTMKPSTLEEVLVTGYTTQRQKDITGAVSVVEVDEMNQVKTTSFIQKLEGQSSGVQISTSGEPGSGTSVRVRGIGSFSGSDPLYIIDGVPVQDAFQTGLNPNDIETIQVLKDASAASIYGSRASNGVIIVTTKKGSSGGRAKVTYEGYVGQQSPVGKYDLIVNPADYSEVVWNAHENGGLEVPSTVPYSAGRGVIPDYFYDWQSTGYPGTGSVDESTYAYPNQLIMKSNQAGTDWWDEVFNPAMITEHTVGVSGGNNNSSYYISAGYLDQQGTMIHTYFNRATVRANSTLKAGRFTFGENFSLARSRSVGQSSGNQSEQNTMTQILKAQSMVNVHDVSGVNFASGKSNGMSNGTNPVAKQFRNKDNEGTFYRILGNVFGQVELIDGLVAKTSLGVDYSDNFTGGFNFPTWENSEPSTVTSWGETWQKFFTWTWSNTLEYKKNFGAHSINALAGYEAIRFQRRLITGSYANYFTTDQNAWYLDPAIADPGTRTIRSNGEFSALVSSFGKADYAYDDKYLVSLTIRRDGSSRLGEEKYGIFPAVSVGWRVTGESFMNDVNWLSDLKIRGGYGIVGNQNIRNYNSFDNFGGGPESASYDITGSNGSVSTGFALTSRGNPLTIWERSITTNVGIDASLFSGKLLVVLDVYKRDVQDLLFNAALPATAGTSSPPFVNIGDMENTGIDVQLDYRTNVGDLNLDFGVNFSRYVNTIVEIDGESESFFATGGDTRIGRTAINQLNNPIGTFYGFTADGWFKSQEEVDAHAMQDGAAVGRVRFADINDDGVINDDDKGVIGSYHPDFTAGITINAEYKGFDAMVFMFGSYGNEIFNYNKLFEVFRFFNTNVRKEVLTESWHPTDNPNGTLHMLDESDVWSEQPSSFYVEDGSFLRLKTLQLGYTIPGETTSQWGMSNLRVFVQAQNILTLTNYSGIDPTLSSFGTRGNGDQWAGQDFGNYPASQIYMFGVSLGF